MAFDFIWIYSFFGIFTYGWSFLFFMTSLYSALKLEEKFSKKFFLVNLLSTFLAWLFHWYCILLIAIGYMAIFLREFITFKKIKIKYFLLLFINVILGFLLSYPFYLPFINYIGVTRTPENIFDLLTFAMDRFKISPIQQFQVIFLTSYVGTIFSAVLILSFFLTIINFRWFKDEKSFFLYLFILLAYFSYLFLGEMNLLRLNSLMWITYAVSLGYFFSENKLNLIFIPILFFVPSPSIPWLINALYNQANIFVPFADFHKFNQAMSFIINNIPENATFLIDGGGSGCTGASASFGERIFPMTSRKIFYFTDYCWAIYNRDEFMKRTDLYRRVSINTSCCIDELKEYNITHVFIGERFVGLNPNLFMNDTNYKLIYDKEGYRIFELKW